LLFGVTQMARTASLLTQGLDGLGHILRLGDIRLAKGRGPREVLVHVFENRRELRHSLYAEIPVLFVYLFRQLFTLEVRMTLHPAVRLDNLGWIGGGGENLRNECVWVQGDRSDKLLQLLRGLPRESCSNLSLRSPCTQTHSLRRFSPPPPIQPRLSRRTAGCKVIRTSRVKSWRKR